MYKNNINRSNKGRPTKKVELLNKIKKTQNRLKAEQDKLRKKQKEEEDLINVPIKIAKYITDKKVAQLVRKYWYSSEPFYKLETLIKYILGERL